MFGLAGAAGSGLVEQRDWNTGSRRHLHDNTYPGSKGLPGLVLLAVAISLSAVSCKQSEQKFDSSQTLAEYQDQQMQRWSKDALVDNATFQAPAVEQPAAFPVGPTTRGHRFTVEDVQRLLKDPLDVDIPDTARPSQVKLSLQDCIRRALENSLAIQIDGYNPAISATDVLAAEARFDALYFLRSQYNKVNQPTPSQLISANSDERIMSTGLSKLLPTGAVIGGTYNLVRSFTDLEFVTLNPSYNSDFSVELRQPILRGFGVDYNRATIDLTRNGQRIAKQQFRQNVRDFLAEVEKTYWQLVQARRDVTIQYTLVKQTKETWVYLEKRKGFDVYRVQLSRAEALLGTREAEYVQVKNRVHDFEDQLKNLLNDPQLNLGEDIEILPTDVPAMEPVVLDHLAEVQAALDNRAEVQQARLNLDNARIQVATAKNQALPKFDVTLRYTLHGLGTNAGTSFDQMSGSNFQDYFVGISFEYPIGNRAARAAMTKRQLQWDQGMSKLQQVIEQVILEVNVAVRQLQTAYRQVVPSIDAVKAAEENLEAIQKRKVAITPEYLDFHLRAQETLASARKGLLAALVNYNIAIIQLERAKGTLLGYNNVVLNSVD